MSLICISKPVVLHFEKKAMSLLVFDYCTCPSLCNCCNFNPRPYCSSDFHLNRVSEVTMLNDLSIKKIFFEMQPLTAAKFAWSDHGEVLDGQLRETMRKNSFACY